MNLSIHRNKIFLNGKKVSCPFHAEVLEKVLEKDGKIIALITNADGTSCPPRNVLCYNSSGKLLWRIPSPIRRGLKDWLFNRRTNMRAYSDLYIFEEKICVSLCAGYEYFLNIQNGSLTERFPGQRPY